MIRSGGQNNSIQASKPRQAISYENRGFLLTGEALFISITRTPLNSDRPMHQQGRNALPEHVEDFETVEIPRSGPFFMPRGAV